MVWPASTGAPTCVLDVATGTAGVGSSWSSAPAPGHRTRPHRGDAAAGQATWSRQRGRPGGTHRRPSRATAVPRRDVRRAHLHLPPALRRRSCGDARASSSACCSPGAPIASLEFLAPRQPVLAVLVVALHPGVLPVAGWLTGGREWYRVGRFLGPNISGALPPLPARLDGRRVGATPGWSTSAHASMSLGGGLVMWGRKRRWLTPTARPAFYAAGPGGWRDWWTLLHPPYTAWHLSYVVIGAYARAHVDGDRLRRDPARVLRRRRCRRPRARRAARTAAPHRASRARCSSATASAAWRGRRARASRGRDGRPRRSSCSSRSARARPRLQPRTVRRLDPHRRGVRRAWGAFPVLVGYFVQAERLDTGRRCCAAARVRPLARAAIAEHPGALCAGASPRARRHPRLARRVLAERRDGLLAPLERAFRRSRGRWSRSAGCSRRPASSSWPRPSTCGRGSAAELREVGPDRPVSAATNFGLLRTAAGSWPGPAAPAEPGPEAGRWTPWLVMHARKSRTPRAVASPPLGVCVVVDTAAVVVVATVVVDAAFDDPLLPQPREAQNDGQR